MPDPLTPAWIASRLTPAQREALLWLPADGSMAEHEPGIVVDELVALDLARFDPAMLEALGEYFYAATRLGLAVRAVLEEGRAGAEIMQEVES